MKRTFAFLFGLVAVTSAPAAIVYQGRLATVKGALTLNDVVDKSMTFRVYDEDGAERWSTNLTVTVATDGSFLAVLDAPDLTALVVGEKAATVGLSVGDAPEILPRRRLQPVPVARNASVATRLAAGATVRQLTVQGLESGELSVGTLRVNGSVRPPAETFVSVADWTLRAGDTLKIGRGEGVSALGQPREISRAKTEVQDEGSVVLAVAPTDGVAFVREVVTDSSGRHEIGSSYVQFCEAGSSITWPVAIKDYKVFFYPFRTDAN